ncbi:MAG: hypothetical protein WBW16_03750 [Bacteroidota bacterium]
MHIFIGFFILLPIVTVSVSAAPAIEMQASSRKKIQVLIIEDNRLLHEGITAIVKERPDIKAVAAFEEGAF